MKRDKPAPVARFVPSPLVWSYAVKPAEPVLWPGVVPPEVRRGLIDHWRQAQRSGSELCPVFDGDRVAPAQMVQPPEGFAPIIIETLARVAEHFELPFAPSSAQAVIARYAPGAGTEWHLDAVKGKKRSDRRTVSFSMLLNGDFEGGDLEIDPGGVADLGPGDLCGFTSRTWHRVSPVLRGERFALVAFGGWGAAS